MSEEEQPPEVETLLTLLLTPPPLPPPSRIVTKLELLRPGSLGRAVMVGDGVILFQNKFSGETQKKINAADC